MGAGGEGMGADREDGMGSRSEDEEGGMGYGIEGTGEDRPDEGGKEEQVVEVDNPSSSPDSALL